MPNIRFTGKASDFLKIGAAAAFLGDREGVESFLKQRPESLNEGHPQHAMGDMTEEGLDWHPAPAPWATPLRANGRGETAREVANRVGVELGVKRS